jgi:NAD(P)-dependent dehydrogenase (short-subunit alcohol dehydrogenase family)
MYSGRRGLIVRESGFILPGMNTVLITGCSSGYGLETARHFHAQGWILSRKGAKAQSATAFLRDFFASLRLLRERFSP